MRGTTFVVLVGAALAMLTASHARTWHDEQTVWTQAATISPLRPRVWVNLGRAQQLAGDDSSALRSYAHAIALSFDERRLHTGNLYARLAAETDTATVFLHQGNVQGAWNELDVVLRDPEWPMFPYAVFHKGVILAMTGRCAQARGYWDLATHADGTLSVPPLPHGLCRE